MKKIIVTDHQSKAEEFLAWLIILTFGVSIVLVNNYRNWKSYLAAIVVMSFTAVIYHMINKMYVDNKRVFTNAQQPMVVEIFGWVEVITTFSILVLRDPYNWKNYLIALVAATFAGAIYRVLTQLNNRRLFTRKEQYVGLEVVGWVVTLIAFGTTMVFLNTKLPVSWIKGITMAFITGSIYHMVVAKREMTVKLLCRFVGKNYDDLSKVDRIKYSVLGSTLFVPLFVSLLSVPYMISVTFKSEFGTVVGSIILPIVVFLVDRSIIATMGPKKQWGIALIRIAMAWVIALFLAKPLEMAMFNQEIKQELAEQKADALKAIDEERKSETEKLRKRKEEAKIPVDKAREEYNTEVNTSIGGRKAGHGIEARKKEEFWKYQTDLYNEAIAKLEKEEQEMNKEYDEKQAQWANNQADGLGARMNALERAGEKYPGIRIEEWIIFLFLMLLDIAPIMAKMLMAKTDDDIKILHDMEIDRITQAEALVVKTYDMVGHEIDKANKLVRKLPQGDVKDMLEKALLLDIFKRNLRLNLPATRPPQPTASVAPAPAVNNAPGTNNNAGTTT